MSVVLFIIALGCPGVHAQALPDDGVLRQLRGDTRSALVIGNANYGPRNTLMNPLNDARAVTKALQQLGFTVSAHEDLNQKDMQAVLRKFRDTLATRRDVAAFYFAGHGMQIGGINYLIPIGADIKSENDVPVEAVPLEAVMQRMTARVNVIILDACRDNPFARFLRGGTQGLAPIGAVRGSIIAYATAPGDVSDDNPRGSNGLYTSALLTYMSKQIRIEDVFINVRKAVASANKVQVPWEAVSLYEEFWLALPEVRVIAQTQVSRSFNVDTGALVVSSAIPGVEILAGGHAVAQTVPNSKLIIVLPAGLQQIQARKSGFTPWSAQIRISPDASSELEINLEPVRTALDLAPGGRQTKLGEGFFYRQQWPEMEGEYRRAVALDPNNFRWHTNLGTALYHQERVDEALAEFGRAVTLAPREPEVHRNLAMTFTRLQKWREAETEYRELVRLEPATAAWHAGLGFVLRKDKRYRDAVSAYGDAIRLAPLTAEFRGALGDVFYDQQEWRNAEDQYLEATKADAAAASYWSDLGFARRRQNEWGGAESAFRQSLALSEDLQIEVELAFVLSQQAKWEEVERVYRKLTRTETKNPAWHSALARALANQQKWTEAESEHRLAIGIAPASGQMRAGLGDLFYAQGRWSDAEREYAEAVRLEPTNAVRQLDVARVLLRQEKFAEAEAAYRAVLKLGAGPETAKAYRGLGTVLLMQGRWVEAEGLSRSSLQLEPNVAATHFALATALQMQKNLREAEAEYREAVRLEPKNAVRYNGLGDVLYEQKQWPGAVEAYAQAVKLAPEEAEFHSNLALALEGQRDYPAAEVEQRKAIRLAPDNVTYQQRLDLLLKR